MLVCKCTAGSGFQVTFKSNCTFIVLERMAVIIRHGANLEV